MSRPLAYLKIKLIFGRIHLSLHICPLTDGPPFSHHRTIRFLKEDFMKFLTILALALSASAFAGHHEMDKNWKKDFEKRPFEENRKMMNEKLDMKSSMVQEAKDCVGKAKDNASLMACKESMMSKKEDMHDHMKDMKKKM